MVCVGVVWCGVYGVVCVVCESVVCESVVCESVVCVCVCVCMCVCVCVCVLSVSGRNRCFAGNSALFSHR